MYHDAIACVLLPEKGAWKELVVSLWVVVESLTAHSKSFRMQKKIVVTTILLPRSNKSYLLLICFIIYLPDNLIFFLLPSPPRQGYLCGFACPRTGFISACPAFQVLGLKASTPCLALGPILMFFCDVVHLCWVMFWCLSLSKWYLVIPQCVPKENYGNKTNLSLLVDLQIEFFSWSLFGILRAIYRWLIRLATVVWCRL